MPKYPLYNPVHGCPVWYSIEEIREVIQVNVDKKQQQDVLACLREWEILKLDNIISDIRYSLEFRDRIWYLIIR